MFRIAFVSRRLESLGTDLAAAARVFEGTAEVTLVTVAEVPEPGEKELDSFYGTAHLWSARAFGRLKELFPDGAPELIELCGSPAEAVVFAQARMTLDPWLKRSLVLLRPRVTREQAAVLDGWMPPDLFGRLEHDLERYALAHADRLLWPGDATREAFERFYGGGLAPGAIVPPAVAAVDEGPAPEPSAAPRLLYAAPLARHLGPQELLRAASGLDRDDWSLTFAGADTLTGSLRTSMRAQLELAAEGDPRVRFHEGPVDADLIREHDLVVAPALFDGWPAEVLAGLAQNRPLLATPVGGHVDVLRGGGGRLAEGTGAEAIGSELGRLLDRPDELAALAGSRVPRRRFEELSDPEPLRQAYSELAVLATGRAARPRPEPPLVSVVVTYFELDAYVEQAVASIFEQTHPRLEALIVNDGSFRQEDSILDELAERYPVTVLTQPNSGVGAARDLGVLHSRGRYVFMLDADNVAGPAFVERCVEVLEERLNAAYVSCWLRFVDERGEPVRSNPAGYQPVSNECASLDRINIAGDAAAVVRRSVFEGGFRYSTDVATHDDWILYGQLATAGLYGHVIPERLVDYRVRRASLTKMLAERQGYEGTTGEVAAEVRRREVQWTA